MWKADWTGFGGDPNNPYKKRGTYKSRRRKRKMRRLIHKWKIKLLRFARLLFYLFLGLLWQSRKKVLRIEKIGEGIYEGKR
jgi:hypothetical protein